VHSQVAPKPDPLNWFGILVPAPLRIAQQDFKKGMSTRVFHKYCAEVLVPYVLSLDYPDVNMSLILHSRKEISGSYGPMQATSGLVHKGSTLYVKPVLKLSTCEVPWTHVILCSSLSGNCHVCIVVFCRWIRLGAHCHCCASTMCRASVAWQIQMWPHDETGLSVRFVPCSSTIVGAVGKPEAESWRASSFFQPDLSGPFLHGACI
jgi:hypothetical protein